ncbi:MAG TPA: hypothetical protein VF852_02180, partial [Pseudolabrys sp.]
FASAGSTIATRANASPQAATTIRRLGPVIESSHVISLLAATRWRCWYSKIPLPDRATIKLYGHSARGKNRTLIPILDPDPIRGKPIHPSARWFTRLVYDIQVPPILGHIGWIADETEPASLHASVFASKVHSLR